jgi:proline dehydrogenase
MGIDRALLFWLATNADFERGVKAIPLGERLAWQAASRYVAGTSADQALDTAEQLHRRGIGSSIDLFGEHVTDPVEVDRVAADYLALAERLVTQPHDVWLSVDLSHLGLDLAAKRCADILTDVARRLPDGRRIQVGAEDSDRTDAVLGCVFAAAANGAADRLGATLQANLRRSADDLDRLADAGVHIRLVKGAFVEPAASALPHGEPTDVAYLRLAHRLAERAVPFALATHDGVLREALLSALGNVSVEQLLGVRPDVLDELRARDVPVRVYVPYGERWFRYWMRRIAESRGA